jgi:hypothetical protein
MSLETSVVPPVSHESCVSVDLPRQPFLLGPAPFVIRDGTAALDGGHMACVVEDGLELLPVPHRYSA